MDLWRSLNGMVQIELVSADSASAISKANAEGITIYDAQCADEITTYFYIRRQDVSALRALAEKRGLELRLCRRSGIYWIGKQFIQRPILMVGLILFLLITAYLPTRVYFFEIQGNTSIPTRLILEKCQECGISFGASRREIRSERMKNALLEAIPELQWAGINTSGCTAIISVRERSISQQNQSNCGVSSIVATRDGVVSQIITTKGNPVCKVGQAVKAGEVLISGYTDCGITIQACQAQGEVYAVTNRDLTVVMPLKWQSQTAKSATEKKYSVIIGKKRINFYKGSGISDATCDKMYEESYVTLPGGFKLPIIVVTETVTYYENYEVTLSKPSLSPFATRYLTQQMVAGTVDYRWEIDATDDQLYTLEGKYACTEMIGQVRSEEIIKPYEQHD